MAEAVSGSDARMDGWQPARPAAGSLPRRSFVRRAGLRFVLCYLALYNLQLGLSWLPGAGWLLARYQELWAAIVPWVGRHVLRLGGEIATVSNGSGDRTFDHVQVLCMAVIAGVAALAWTVGERRPRQDRRLADGLRILLRYALGVTLLAGGMSMMLKVRFPFPGVDRLQQRLGDASPMGLLEVFLGYSTPYAVFNGAVEALAGILLFFRRFTTLGALLAMAVLANAAMLAFSYHVPLKLYSLHMVAMAALLLAPDARRLADGLLLDRPTAPANVAPPFAGRRTRIIRLTLKTALILYALLAVTKHALDRRQELALVPRAPIQGVYDVEEFNRNGRIVPSWSGDPARWRQLIAGSPEALTVKLMSGPRRLRTAYVEQQVTLLSDEGGGKLVRQGIIAWSRPDREHLVLQGEVGGDRLIVKLRRIDETGYLLVTRGFRVIDDDPINR
jgi:uncharacterized membrane protein YphA (DoxX/SURF4 family)